MSKPVHRHAHQQAHHFIELFWDELPTGWQDNISLHQFEFELWLATFDLKRERDHLSGFSLLRAARTRAEKYYQRDLKQVHHTPAEWAFFRFRLELALLKTCGADTDTILHCAGYANLLAHYAYTALTDSSRPYSIP